MTLKMTPTRAALAAAITSLVGIAATAEAQLSQNFLQWYELEWDDIERRTPDMFLAGYNAIWLPPPQRSSFLSVGYDVFDRFDLGQPPLATTSSSRRRTTYGTEATFKAMVEELHLAGVEVYVDGVFNHNSGRTTSDAFYAQGGYPGFWIPREDPPRDKLPTDDWGDFHGGNAQGYYQSENPGGINYDQFLGDLVALVDIAQESNNQFIRHPVEEGNPDNIPAGTIFNIPDPNNARFYPDQSLTPDIVVNPGTSRNPGPMTFTRYPYNTANPMQGDPVVDNGTGLLMRWAQWMMEEQGIDGFRLDALKHTPSWFWDGFFDSAVHMTRTTPDGRKINPFNFGENTTSNSDIIANYTRRDTFAYRDSLDLGGAGNLRNLLNGGGLGTWANVLAGGNSGHLDVADDGFVNGSLGVNHVFSHDNGSVGDGGSLPPIPTTQQQGHFLHAYMLMRPGRAIVYHNARGVPLRSSGFFPREGSPLALGWDPVAADYDDTYPTLLRIRNQVANGFYFQLNSNVNDVLVFERAFNNQANVIVGVNDRFDAGFQTVTVNTQYDQGTRLHELTGNAADPIIDPNNDIPEVIVVGANGSVTLRVPNNTSSAGTHAKGYVIYAQALPTAELSIIGESSTIDPDDPALPDWFQRLSEISVVDGDSFQIRVQTSQTDPLDPDTDDNALFKIDQGVEDYNGNGAPDISPAALSFAGFEEFLEINDPLYTSANSFGLYRQTIDATQLDEGMHYLTTVVFKRRPSGTSPLYTELRKVIYVDRLPPEVEFVQEGQNLEDTSPELSVKTLDRTTEALHMLIDVPSGTDPLTLINTSTRVAPYDRNEFRRSFGTLSDGTHELTVVAIEPTGTTTVHQGTFTIGDGCLPDFTGDGQLDFFDLSAFLMALGNEDPQADLNPDGQYDFFDVSAFLTLYQQGCP